MMKPYLLVFLILLIILIFLLRSTIMRYVKCRTTDFRLQTDYLMHVSSTSHANDQLHLYTNSP